MSVFRFGICMMFRSDSSNVIPTAHISKLGSLFEHILSILSVLLDQSLMASF